MRNLKKLLSLVLALALVLSVGFSAFAATIEEYQDADKAKETLGEYGDKLEGVYADAVQLMIDLSVLKGNKNPDGSVTLDLGDYLTRGQFMVMLYKATKGGAAIENNEPSYLNMATARFSDVGKGHWAYGYVNWAGTNSISAGYPDGRFGVDDPITLEQALLLCMKTIGLKTQNEYGFEGTNAQILSLASQLGLLGDLYAQGNSNEINRATACLMFQYMIYAEQVKYAVITGERYRTGDQSVIGMWGVGASNPSYTLAWAKFKLVHGTFTVISDGSTWGLPNIGGVVESDAYDSFGALTGKPPVNNGGLSEGRAVIQRPYEWDRRSGAPTEWDTYILSAEQTKEMEIGLHDIGRQVEITFEHPDKEESSHIAPGGQGALPDESEYRPGQYHRLNVGKVFRYDWKSDVKVLHGASALNADNLGGGLPGNNRIFVDYDNSAAQNAKLYVGANSSNGTLNYTNADVYVITNKSTGAIEWVFVENYRIAKVKEVPGSGNDHRWILTGPGGGAINWLNNRWTASGTDRAWNSDVYDDGNCEKGNYVGICTLTVPAQWYADGGSNYGAAHMLAGQRYIMKNETTQESGLVQSVTGNADVTPGSGTLTMGSKPYVMLTAPLAGANAANYITAFATADVTYKKTISLWHGRIVDIDATVIDDTYCLVTASGADVNATWNTNTWKYMVEVLLEDGTTGQYALDKIVMRNGTAATENRPAISVGAGQYGLDGGTATSQIKYSTASALSVGQDLFKSKTEITNHVFRYTLSGNKITLYDDAMIQQGGDKNQKPADGKVEATSNGRFNASWGETLGKTYGLNNTRGLMMKEDESSIFIKSKDSKGNSVYRVYNQNVPGFTGVNSYTTETLPMDANGVTGSGVFVRAAFIDMDAVTASNTRTHWAVALDWWVQNDSNSAYAGTVSAMLSTGETVELRCRDERSTNGTAFSKDPIRRGDVFTYESEDGTPYTISDVTILDSDVLVGNYTRSGSLSVFGIMNAANNALLSDTFFGTSGNNHFFVNATNGDAPVAKASAATVSDWGIGLSSGSSAWNLYIFSDSTRGNYSNVTECLLVKRSGNDGRSKDLRNYTAKVAAIKTAMTNLTASGTTTVPAGVYSAANSNAAIKNAIENTVNGILSQYGPACYLTGAIDFSGAVTNNNGTGDSTAAAVKFNFVVAGIPVTGTDNPFLSTGAGATVYVPGLDPDLIAANAALDVVATAISSDNAGSGTYLLDAAAASYITTDNTSIAVKTAIQAYVDDVISNDLTLAAWKAATAGTAVVTMDSFTAATDKAVGSATATITYTKGAFVETDTVTVVVPATSTNGWLEASVSEINAYIEGDTFTSFTITAYDIWGDVDTAFTGGGADVSIVATTGTAGGTDASDVEAVVGVATFADSSLAKNSAETTDTLTFSVSDYTSCTITVNYATLVFSNDGNTNAAITSGGTLTSETGTPCDVVGSSTTNYLQVALSGYQGLQINAETAGLETGHTYVIRLNARYDAAADAGVKIGDNSGNQYGASPAFGADTWTAVEVEFTYTETPAGKVLRVEIKNKNSGNAWFDDIFIYDVTVTP